VRFGTSSSSSSSSSASGGGSAAAPPQSERANTGSAARGPDSKRGAAAPAEGAHAGAAEDSDFLREEYVPWEKGSATVAETESLVRIYNAIM
jgi:hypothetical protein